MDRRYLYPAIILVGVIVVAVIICVFLNNPKTTILLVRHAERESNDSNTNLSDPGKDRAELLVAVAEDAGVAAIYTTEYCRTSQTAQPLASQLGLPLIVQDNGLPGDQLSDVECDPDIDVPIERLPVAINTIPELVGEVLSEYSGRVVLIAGHSDTVPEIIEELGANPLCPDYFPPGVGGSCNIPANQFDNLFIVTVPRFFGDVRIVKAQYGN